MNAQASVTSRKIKAMSIQRKRERQRERLVSPSYSDTESRLDLTLVDFWLAQNQNEEVMVVFKLPL